MVERRQDGLAVVVVGGGVELEVVVVMVADRQVQGGDLLAVELVVVVRRMVESASGDGGEGAMGRNRCILQHKSEDTGDRRRDQGCDPKYAPARSLGVLDAKSDRG